MQKVTNYYDTMEINGIQVSGTLSVAENIADLSGVFCMTEIAKEKGYDLKELYHAYGVIWTTKYRNEYLSYIMTNDTHSPSITRVNAVLPAIDDFCTAFGVREGDGMYHRPEDRPHIWWKYFYTSKISESGKQLPPRLCAAVITLFSFS